MQHFCKHLLVFGLLLVACVKSLSVGLCAFTLSLSLSGLCLASGFASIRDQTEAHGILVHTLTHTHTQARTILSAIHTLEHMLAPLKAQLIHSHQHPVNARSSSMLHSKREWERIVSSRAHTHRPFRVSGLILVWLNYFVSVLGNERARKHRSRCL